MNNFQLTITEAVNILIERVRRHLLDGGEIEVEEHVLTITDVDRYGEKRTVPTGEIRYTIVVKPK